MNKDDALRKVRSLVALAESTSEHEAEVARDAAIRLRLRYGIGDDDLVVDDDDDLEIMGMKVFWYSKRITPRLVCIKSDIDRAQQAMKSESLHDRLDNTARMYRDLTTLLDNQYGKGVKQVRDELVREYYEEQLVAFMRDEEEGADITMHAHRMAVSYTAMASDLRKDHIERIVGRSEKKMWDDHLKRMQEEDSAS